MDRQNRIEIDNLRSQLKQQDTIMLSQRESLLNKEKIICVDQSYKSYQFHDLKSKLEAEFHTQLALNDAKNAEKLTSLEREYQI